MIGSPGAGKSMLVIECVVGLLCRPREDAGHFGGQQDRSDDLPRPAAGHRPSYQDRRGFH